MNRSRLHRMQAARIVAHVGISVQPSRYLTLLP
jgi:hypothetical protein